MIYHRYQGSDPSNQFDEINTINKLINHCNVNLLQLNMIFYLIHF
jgi:hypothetical protein